MLFRSQKGPQRAKEPNAPFRKSAGFVHTFSPGAYGNSPISPSAFERISSGRRNSYGPAGSDRSRFVSRNWRIPRSCNPERDQFFSSFPKLRDRFWDGGGKVEWTYGLVLGEDLVRFLARVDSSLLNLLHRIDVAVELWRDLPYAWSHIHHCGLVSSHPQARNRLDEDTPINPANDGGSDRAKVIATFPPLPHQSLVPPQLRAKDLTHIECPITVTSSSPRCSTKCCTSPAISRYAAAAA